MTTKRFHNIFDLENCNEKISDKETLKKFVKNIAKTLEMNILEGPIVADGIQSNPGLSAFAIIDFSHISIHTFTKYREALIDIYSCKEYDRNRVVEVCKKFFTTPNTKIREKKIWWG